MTILRVKFPQNWPGWNIPEYILTAPARRGLPAITAIVDPEFPSDYFCDTPVFRASIEGSSATVALKFAFRDDLIDELVGEADVYTRELKPLQGKSVPRCYGLYNGLRDEEDPMACLVLEFWGECIQKPFKYLPIDTRIRILQRLGEIHRRGLWHGDFAERNVLYRDGDIRIIDFNQTEKHNCDCTMDFRPGDKLPDARQFGCFQLWDICRSEMKIWG